MTKNRTTEQITMEHHTTDLGGLRLHHVEAGSGEPVLLWHGFLGSWYSWRRLIPPLAQRGYRVVAPDMRGYGDSDKPATGYDALTLARGFRRLAEHLGLGPHHVVAHDMGAPPALVYAAEYPEAVRSLVWIEEPVPGFGSREMLAFSPETAEGGGLWWWCFGLVPDLPEALIAGKERDFLSYFCRKYCYDPTAIGPDDIDEYLRTFAAPGGIRGALGVYRAIFETEAQMRERFAEKKLEAPVLALGGEASMGTHAAEMVSRVARDVQGGTVERCGHFVPEERPEELAERLLAFFSEGDPPTADG